MVILTSPVIRWNFDIGPAGRFKQLLYLCLKISWAAVLDATAKAFLSFGFPFLFNGSSGFARFCNFFAFFASVTKTSPRLRIFMDLFMDRKFPVFCRHTTQFPIA